MDKRWDDLWPHPPDGGPVVFRRRFLAPRPEVVVRAELAMFMLYAPQWTGRGAEGADLSRRWLVAKQELMAIEAWKEREALERGNQRVSPGA